MFLEKRSTCLKRIYNNYKERLSVPRVHTDALVEANASVVSI